MTKAEAIQGVSQLIVETVVESNPGKYIIIPNESLVKIRRICLKMTQSNNYYTFIRDNQNEFSIFGITCGKTQSVFYNNRIVRHLVSDTMLPI